jgi:hypothetical protein
MATSWRLWAKWGSSCDIGFDATNFLKKHLQYEWLEGYLRDFPAKPWTVFPSEQAEPAVKPRLAPASFDAAQDRPVAGVASIE